MSFEDFLTLYAADTKRSPTDLLAEHPLSFPVSANARGEAFVDFLTSTLDIDLSGKRVMDIGCAYGGLSVALAKAEASVTGIDISPKLLSYAEANIRGLANIDLRVLDASDVTIRHMFSRHSFDLIVLNDVLEHIYDTTRLFSNIDYLLNDRGFVYFKVPNGLSPRYILSEGHRKIFGLSLLDPDCWFYLCPKRASIFYRPMQYFEAIFSFFDLSQIIWTDHEDVFRRFSHRKLKSQIREVFQKLRDYDFMDASIKPVLRHQIIKFRDEYDHDLENYGEDYVKFKYGSYFYIGFAGRSGAQIWPRTPVREIPEIGRIAAKPEIRANRIEDLGT